VGGRGRVGISRGENKRGKKVRRTRSGGRGEKGISVVGYGRRGGENMSGEREGEGIQAGGGKGGYRIG